MVNKLPTRECICKVNYIDYKGNTLRKTYFPIAIIDIKGSNHWK